MEATNNNSVETKLYKKVVEKRNTKNQRKGPQVYARKLLLYSHCRNFNVTPESHSGFENSTRKLFEAVKKLQTEKKQVSGEDKQLIQV